MNSEQEVASFSLVSSRQSVLDPELAQEITLGFLRERNEAPKLGKFAILMNGELMHTADDMKEAINVSKALQKSHRATKPLIKIEPGK